MQLGGISHWITIFTIFFRWDIGFVNSYLMLIHSKETSQPPTMIIFLSVFLF